MQLKQTDGFNYVFRDTIISDFNYIIVSWFKYKLIKTTFFLAIVELVVSDLYHIGSV